MPTDAELAECKRIDSIRDAEDALNQMIRYIVGNEPTETSNLNLQSLLTLKWIFSEFDMDQIAKRDLTDHSAYFKPHDDDPEMGLWWNEWLTAKDNIIYLKS